MNAPRRNALAGLLLALAVLAAGWWAWPRERAVRRVFSPPALFELQFPGGEGVSSSLFTEDGRIHADRDLMLVMKALAEPTSIGVEELQRRGELRLGAADGPGASLVVAPGGLQLHVRGESPASHNFPGLQPASVVLQYTGEGYVAVADGRALEPALPGPAPPGPAALSLSRGGSLRRLTAGNAAGEVRVVQDTEQRPGLPRVAWAVLSTLGLGLALRGWWRLVPGGWRAGAAERLAGSLVTVALALGLASTLHANNRERLGRAPAACDEQPCAQPEARTVEPGRTYDVPGRRDGDFRLSALVTLQPGTVLDVLLRASPTEMDRQILLTLSTEGDLSSGFSRNHGTFLQSQPAPDEQAILPAGRPLQLEVTAEDDTLQATLDGRPLGRIRDLDLRAGRTAFHALSGSATVALLAIEPLGQPRALASRLLGWQLGAAALAVLGVAFLARRSGRGWGAALSLAPLAVVGQPQAPEALLVPGLLAAGLLCALTPVRGGRILSYAASAALLALTLWARGEQAPPELSPTVLNAMRPADVAGPPLSPRYLFARHPLGRRFNAWLRTQTFRERHVAVRKPEGAPRIATLGSSSTFGYGVGARQTWSFELERLLRQATGQPALEVVNAGVPGATAERLRFFLLGVVLPLQPDLVIIDLGYNDHVIGCAQDERRHFSRMTSEGIGWLERLVEQVRAGRNLSGLVRFRDGWDSGVPPDPEDVERYESAPARRFADTLRDMVAACRAAGAAVVLVEEPVREGGGGRTLDAFHAAMAELGAALGVPVARPQAALDEALRNGEQDGALFVDNNRDFVHPSAIGHRIIAQDLLPTVLPLLAGPR